MLLPIFIGVLLAVVCSPDAAAEVRTDRPYWMPPTATENGQQTDLILNTIFWLTAGVFVLTQGFYIYYLIRYRRREGVKAHYIHGNNLAEIIWTALPTAVFLGLAIWGDHVWNQLTKTPAPNNAIEVEIVGYQFAWDFRYGGEDGELDEILLEKMGGTENKFGLKRADFDQSDDFSTTEMVIPVGVPVHVILRARDVIHSFYVPEFRLYQDAVPGRTIDWMWFVTTREGNFELACNQLCGTGHYNMKAPIRVVSQEVYDEWHAGKVKARAEEIAATSEPDKVAAAQ
ncbi:MAG: cytochrome c oxidase subunit II [Chthoniobacterales bacterium]